MAGILELFKESTVIDKNGQAVDIEKICKDKAIGIYFSAHWCPPCRGFTPVLAKYYEDNSEKFECIFVSSDRDEASFKEYFGEMPWHALAFTNRDKKNELAQKYGIQGIPALIILRPNGTIITANGRGGVVSGKKPEEWLTDDSAVQQKS